METILEIVRIEQVIREAEEGVNYIIRSPEDGAKIASRFIGRDDREVFFVMCLNTKNNVIAVHRCHVGSLNASLVHPREVFKSAILNNAANVIGLLIGMEFSRRNNKSLCFQRYIIFASFFVAKITNSKDKTEIILVKDLYYTSNELNNLT
ncbi:JAB domain-containing protein [Sporosarcina sp. ACRSM]|jgi:hypothetical protein|uniref:JAB domain-containing protein n=1 Tax=Bacillales TaxID=1385 RepID=UPI001EF66894|nr:MULTISPECIES: JAB domain-containing protein [Bacillales]MCG7335396.1 JAB domain-containing protein [Sporosarcina sp. ACRSM]